MLLRENFVFKDEFGEFLSLNLKKNNNDKL